MAADWLWNVLVLRQSASPRGSPVKDTYPGQLTKESKVTEFVSHLFVHLVPYKAHWPSTILSPLAENKGTALPGRSRESEVHSTWEQAALMWKIIHRYSKSYLQTLQFSTISPLSSFFLNSNPGEVEIFPLPELTVPTWYCWTTYINFNITSMHWGFPLAAAKQTHVFVPKSIDFTPCF